MDRIEPRAAPSTISETGLDIGTLVPLLLKTIYYGGDMPESAISTRIALPLALTTELLQFLRGEGLCQVTGGSAGTLGASRYALTSKGVEQAVDALSLSGYVGPAPVPLDDYIDQVRAQSIHEVDISPHDIETSFSHLVLPQETRALIGQAVTSKKAMLIHGASGNGKTSAALGLGSGIRGRILIPYAIEVMREIIQLHDPLTHKNVEHEHEERSANAARQDQRWVVIERPTVFAAGELAATHLELILDQVHKTYESPIQLKANGGLLIIDDFGRQHLDAAYLLNRWITPLERGIDHLSLHSGSRFEVPFDVIPVFVSNRPPKDLADDAFMRRIRYKVEVPSPDVPMFTEILKQECARNDVAYEESGATHLIDAYFSGQDRELRGCHPRDLVEMIADAARYQGREPGLTRSAIDKACEHYFA